MAWFSKKEETVTVTVSNRTVVRVILMILATILGLRFLDNVSNILVLIFVAFFLALALNPAVSWITHRLKNKSRVRATAVAYLAVLAVLATFIVTVVPPLVSQTVDFVRSIPQTLEDFKTQDSALARFVRDNNLDKQLDELIKDFDVQVQDVREPVLNTAGRIGAIIVSIITVLVLTFMMLVEGPYWMNRLLELQPREKQQYRKTLALKMYRVVTGYVNGQLLIALIGAAFAMVALYITSTIIGVSINAVGLAGIVALTGLIPMIGNTIGAVFVVLICLFTSVPLAIIMGVFFIIYQQIENVTIQPYIQSKHNEMTPLLVFIAALLGIGFGGLLGGLIAIPTAGCLRILAKEYIARRQNS